MYAWKVDLNSNFDKINECLESYYVQVAYLDSNKDFDVINEHLEPYYA